MAAEERAPINFGSIDGERLVEKPIFKMRVATEPMIKSLKTKEVEAKVWNSEHLMSSVVAKSGFTNFKLSEGKLPSIKDKLARRGSQSAASLPSPGDSTDFRGRFGMKRADHYFQLLMKAKQKTEEANRKLAEADDLKRAEGAARQAFRKLVGADDRSEATTDSEADDMDEDYGPLTAFDGQMKIDIDFVVVVPHRDEDKEDVFIYPTHPEVLQASVGGPVDPEMAPFETPPQSASSGESTPMDFSDEMESLKVELKKAGQLEEPKGIAQRDNVRAAVEPGQGVSSEKTMPNIWDNPYPEWTLETGGSMYFIPDAERYAWCPSLPPPPPPSMLGRRRLRLKPRLPLALSNHRYKDEHPNIFPPDPFSPSKGHYASWEKKVLTYDLYKSCVESLSQMPPQEFAKDAYKHKLQFGSHMEKALRKSRAWRNWRSRENQRLKDEEAQKQQERENEAKRQLEKEKKQKAAEEALRLAEDDDDW